jgi:hypothetical protein
MKCAAQIIRIFLSELYGWIVVARRGNSHTAAFIKSNGGLCLPKASTSHKFWFLGQNGPEQAMKSESRRVGLL